MLMTRDEARKLVDRILSYSTADECEVAIGASDVAHNRFANNSITTTGATSGIMITIASTRGGRKGTSATNEAGDSALKAAVAKSEELAGYAPSDPEYVEPLGPQKYPEVPGAYDRATADAVTDQLLQMPEMQQPNVHLAVEIAP